MLFSGITFLLYFLPVSIFLYIVTPAKFKNAIIVFISLFFYGWGQPKHLPLLVTTVMAGYGCGLLIDYCHKKEKGAKAVLVTGIAFILSMLAVFKYADFVVASINDIFAGNIGLPGIILPIGISFYSFQLISYLFDVYRKDVKAEKNIIDFTAYIIFFPQLIAGPIVRYTDISEKIKNRSLDIHQVSYGISRFIIGLSKKMIIANSLANVCSAFHSSGEKSVLFCWLYAVSYSLQVYFDFSGYSDMAIGIGAVFGFELPENFRYPFTSKSVTEFWRRWHITLGSWFRDYVYIPLGGSRCRMDKHIRNILIVWGLTGLWHGASWNFVIWGIYYGALLLLEKFVLRRCFEKLKVIPYIFTFLATITGFIIFDNTLVSESLNIIKGLIGLGGYSLLSLESVYYLRSYGLTVCIGIIGATSLPKFLYQKFSDSRAGQFITAFIQPAVLLVLLMICVAFLVDGSFNPFLYFRF